MSKLLQHHVCCALQGLLHLDGRRPFSQAEGKIQGMALRFWTLLACPWPPVLTVQKPQAKRLKLPADFLGARWVPDDTGLLHCLGLER